MLRNLECQGGWHANHDVDFSGDVVLYRPNNEGWVRVPFVVLAEIVAAAVRRQRQDELNIASPATLLGLPARVANPGPEGVIASHRAEN